MNTVAVIGHNLPPDPIDEALKPYGDDLAEAEGWLDGKAVETEGQMTAVDALLKSVKAARKAAEGAEESEAKPVYDQWKAIKARFKPRLDDIDRIAKGLVAIVDAFKRRLAAEKAEAERQARAEAEDAMRAAQEAARAATAGDIASQRAAAKAQEDAEAAQRAASAASKDTVKGLRTVTLHAVDDHKAALNWIARNDKPALAAFVDEYARQHHKSRVIPGVRVWTEKQAY